MKRVWVIALAGWLVALVNCIAFVLASQSPEPSGAIAAQTCEEVLVYQFAGIETGNLIMLAEANRRAVELGC
jgi:hypothetical protein